MATQMTTNTITLANGTTKLAFSYLNSRAPQTSQFDAGMYVTTVLIAKGSKDEQDFRNQYENIRAEALQTFGVEIPFADVVLHDGDRKNAELQAEGKDTVNSYVNNLYFKIRGKYPIRLYDKDARECKAIANNGAFVKDPVTNSDSYYLPGIETSKVNVCIKFNVGIANTGKPYAKPYAEWIQQIEPSVAISYNAPTAWTGAPSQPQARPVAMPTAPIANTAPAAPVAPVQQYVPQAQHVAPAQVPVQAVPQYVPQAQQYVQPMAVPQMQNVAVPQTQPVMAPQAPQTPVTVGGGFPVDEGGTLPFEI